jgi:hypothetical protein
VSDSDPHDCHERISAEALQRVGYVARRPAVRRRRRFARRPAVRRRPVRRNIYALSFIIGSALADSQGEPSFDFYKLSNVHNAPGDQAAHCLREESDTGAETGDTHALAACRARSPRCTGRRWRPSTRRWAASIRTSGPCSPSTCRSWARRRSRCPASISSPGARAHAVQDSFTHTYRRMTSPNAGHAITSVFNWESQVRGDLVESVNGHGHETILDDCEDDNPSNADRLGWATDATTVLLAALTTPGTAAERQTRLDAFFTRMDDL